MLTVALVSASIFLLVAGLVVHAARRPATMEVVRSTEIGASPDAIFPFLEDFHRWENWSPYERLDPGMRRTHSGPEKGKGAHYAWDGDRKIGAGSMTIRESIPDAKVVLDLEFLRPMESRCVTTIALEPQGGATRVTWTMVGPAPLSSRIVGTFLDLDALIGKDFEAGLATLKATIEA